MTASQSASKSTSQSTYAVTLDSTECCASGMCASIAPGAFAIDAGGYAVVLPGAATAEPATLIRAARNCPTLCISIARDGDEIDLFA